MKREINSKSFVLWLLDIWEEIEIQLFGIAGALIFFFLIYLFFHPTWMNPLIDFISNINLSL